MWFFTTDTWRNRRGLFSSSPEAARFRTVATAATALIYLQIVLGAFLRQHGRGIDEGAAALHVTGAFAATGLVLAVFVLAQKHFDDNTVIRRASWVLLGTVGVQFALGLSAFIVMLYEAPQGIRSTLQVLLTVGHLVGGSVLLGASVVTTLLARRPTMEAFSTAADAVPSDGAPTSREPALARPRTPASS
jgi:cytochrome c oxidase assembly protein subunit 15